MASLSKTKTLFGFTSPRTLEKIIPEIKLLIDNYKGQIWSGNSDLQARFFIDLFNSDFYQASKTPTNLALAARDRITRAPKSLGFVQLKPQIDISEVGELLLSGKRTDETFTRQLLKFQLPSPYHTQSKTETFKIKPYLELLRLVYEMKSLSKTEISIFFLQLTNIEKYNTVKQKIENFRTKMSMCSVNKKQLIEEIFDKEVTLIFQEKISNGDLATRESSNATLKKFLTTKKANMRDYADAFIRYLRATGLITFERRTIRIIISPTKKVQAEFILKNISREPIKFKNKEEFNKYLFDPYSIKLFSDDKKLILNKINKLSKINYDSSLTLTALKDILENLETSEKEKNLARQKSEIKSSTGLSDIKEIFHKIKKKEIPDSSLFFEWNVWRTFVLLNYAKRIDGNFTVDIDGMPLSTAPGKKADIEIEYDDFGIIAEVTLSSGATQFKMESDSVPRHYGEFKKRINKDAYCIFLSPKIHDGTKAFFFNLNKGYTTLYGGKTKIIPLDLEHFLKFIDIGIDNNFSNPSQLRDWLEQQCETNQLCFDEKTWTDEIKKNIHSWASSM